MAYKTTKDMLESFKWFAGNFNEKKGSFPVHPDYLIDGMTESEFNSAYDEYRRLMFDLQNDMCDKPDEYGLFTYDKNNNAKPAYQNNYPYLWLFLALSLSGEIKNDVLYVDINKFNEFADGKAVGSHTGSPRNIDKLIYKLKDFGFEIAGYNDRLNNFTIASENRRLMSVIKASTLSQYALKSMKSDYVAFNEKLYAIGKREQIKIEDTHTYKLLPPRSQQFASALVSELAKTGWKSYTERHHDTNGGRLTYPTLEYYYNSNDDAWNDEYKSNWIFIRLDNVFNHIDYINHLPSPHREMWEKTMKCRGCRKGECPKRYVGMIFDKNGAWCSSAKPTYQCKIEDIPHMVEVARVMAKK